MSETSQPTGDHPKNWREQQQQELKRRNLLTLLVLLLLAGSFIAITAYNTIQHAQP